MSNHASDNKGTISSSAIGSVVRELIALLLTILFGIVLIVALLLLPQFVPELSTLTFAPYLSAVKVYLLQFFSYTGSNSLINAGTVKAIGVAAIRSFQLLGISLTFALPLALVWGGLLATVRQPLLYGLLFSINTLFNAMPSFVVFLLLGEAIATWTLRTGWQIANVQGYGLDKHLILPTTVLVLRGAAFGARQLKIAQEQIATQGWICVARAKGLGGLRLWLGHMVPASQVPLLGITLGMLRIMVASFIIVDYIYGWGGLGYRMFRWQQRNGQIDNAAVGSIVLLLIFFVAADALGQFGLRYVDPRLRGRVDQ